MDCVGIIDLTGDEVRCQHRREVRVDDIVVLGRGHRNTPLGRNVRGWDWSVGIHDAATWHPAA